MYGSEDIGDETKPEAFPKRLGAGWRSWMFGLVLLSAIVGGILHFGELEEFAQLVRRAQPTWLLLALALQVGTYASVAQGWRVVLTAAGTRKSLLPLMRIALSKLFADQALPSAGIGGNVLLVDQLVAIGAPRGVSSATLLVSIIGYYAAFACCALVTLVLLWFLDEASLILAATLTLFLLVAIGIPAGALWLTRGGTSKLSPRLHRWKWSSLMIQSIEEAPRHLLADRQLMVRVASWNLCLFLADGLTLWACLMALGQSVAPWIAFVSLVMASVVTTLGPVPMGLGSFEATSIGLLHLLGVPAEAAFAGTMLLRMFTLWLPLVPGVVFVRRVQRRRIQQN